MRISVLIPYYRGERTLPRTLQALRHVNLPPSTDLEVVVAPDGGTPPEVDAGVARELNLKMAPGAAGGQSAATNRAARRARGDLLWLLAQDIAPAPDSLLRLLQRYAQHPGALVQGMIEHAPTDRGDAFVEHVLASGLQFTYENVTDPDRLDPGLHYAPHALVERQHFLVLGGYDEALPYGMQDTDFALRWRLNGDSFVLAAESRVTHHHHYRYSAYRERERRIGGSLVDMFMKWGKEAYLTRYRMSRGAFAKGLGPDLDQAHILASTWEDTGQLPAGTGGLRDPLPVPGDPLRSAFVISLGWARLEGVRERLIALDLWDSLPPLPPGFDIQHHHPTQWIRELADQDARRR